MLPGGFELDEAQLHMGPIDGRHDIELVVPDDVAQWVVAAKIVDGSGTIRVIDADGAELYVGDLADVACTSVRRGAFVIRLEGRGIVSCWRSFARPRPTAVA